MKDEKRTLRDQIEEQRAKLDDRERQDKAMEACRHVLKQPFFAKNQKASGMTVCMYMPFRYELDITPVIEYCWQQGYQVLIPKVIKEDILRGRSLSLHKVDSYADLETGAWGIREPKKTTKPWNYDSSIDIMIVPGIAFDHWGGRLGYGGGFYDRLHESYNQAVHPLIKPLQISVAFDLQMVPRVPMEPHDLRVSQVFTESGPQINS